MVANKKNVIIIVDNSIDVTGALKAILNATIPLSAEFKFIYILPQKSKAVSYIIDKGLSCQTLPFIEISKRPKDLLLYLPYLVINGIRLFKIAKFNNAAIIHINDFYNLTGVLVKLLNRQIKLVTHVRFMPQKFTQVLSKLWSKINLMYADKLICVSEAVGSYFLERRKVYVIYDPLPEEEKHPVKIIKQKEQNAIITLLYLSNYIRGKGQEYALLAFKEAFLVNKNLRLVFTGGDMGLDKNKAFRKELEHYAEVNNLSEVVSFESFARDVEKKIKEADILLNFSESESFSLTCLDALYFGTPLIATDSGGPAELFENGRSGLLVPVKDTKAMTLAILKLSSDYVIRCQFSEEGKIYVRNKFGPKNTFMKLREIYST